MTTKPTSDKELIELGRKLQDFYEMGYINKREALFFTFLKGVVGGLGAVIGGTVVVALLLWFLSNLKEVPFVGPISNNIKTTIQQKR